MTNQEILKKAIEKAERNGFDGDGYELGLPLNIIFNHDFAKAIFGETPAHQVNGSQAYWQYHLQQMVLEKEPLKYLEKFIWKKK